MEITQSWKLNSAAQEASTLSISLARMFGIQEALVRK